PDWPGCSLAWQYIIFAGTGGYIFPPIPARRGPAIGCGR
ncbi:DUF3789 domain-containing protein, partial [Dysosmobacter welbionis]